MHRRDTGPHRARTRPSHRSSVVPWVLLAAVVTGTVLVGVLPTALAFHDPSREAPRWVAEGTKIEYDMLVDTPEIVQWTKRDTSRWVVEEIDGPTVQISHSGPRRIFQEVETTGSLGSSSGSDGSSGGFQFEFAAPSATLLDHVAADTGNFTVDLDTGEIARSPSGERDGQTFWLWLPYDVAEGDVVMIAGNPHEVQAPSFHNDRPVWILTHRGTTSVGFDENVQLRSNLFYDTSSGVLVGQTAYLVGHGVVTMDLRSFDDNGRPIPLTAAELGAGVTGALIVAGGGFVTTRRKSAAIRGLGRVAGASTGVGTCPNCGARTHAGDSFCGYCGEVL